MNDRILIIEDDTKIVELVTLYLKKEGFKVISALDGKKGLKLYQKEKPSLVILDLMLPEKDGLSVLRDIRAEGNTPVIILSSKGEEMDKIVGLELGADDYVTKPFSPKELVVRVKAVLRRINQDTSHQKTYKINNLKIDLERFEVKKENQIIPLTRREFHLLAALAEHPGKVYSREELMETVYSGHDLDIFDRTIDVHISNLRKKLNDQNQEIISTVTGVGYKLTD